MKKIILLTYLLIMITLIGNAQSWPETSLEKTSPGTTYTKFQFAEHTWSGSHAILFNAFKSVTVGGSLGALGNTKYANNQGSYGGGAGAIMFYGNGGKMDFLISPAAGATGQNTSINWGTPKMRILRNGEVKIGTRATSTSGFKLAVAGSIRASEIKVDALPWPDFVFANDYQLRSLDEVAKFIDENQHLPEIPSEVEVNENGINLGELNAKLLQKIEELTLYLIEENQQNRKQQMEIETLKKANIELLKKINER